MQYIHVLQDSKRYITHLTTQVQPNPQVTDIPLTEKQRLKDDQLSTSLRRFNLPLGIGPNVRVFVTEDRQFKWSSVSACTWI